MWLTDNIKHHNKTISDFRKDNKKAMENLFKDFSILVNIRMNENKETYKLRQ